MDDPMEDNEHEDSEEKGPSGDDDVNDNSEFLPE
jgi:hypothetical protein